MVIGWACVAGAAAQAPTLTQLTARARVVVVGQVSAVTSYDSGRFSVAGVQVSRWLKGDGEAPRVEVVERHDVASDPDLLHAGDSVVAFLVPAVRTSSLLAAVPAGSYLSPVDVRFGVVVGRSPEALAEVVTFVERRLQLVAVSDASARATQERVLVFDEIAARHSAVVADGAGGLTRVAKLQATLAPRERERLEAALHRTDLPDRVRIALVDAVAAAGLTQLRDALQSLPGASADVTAAAWAARRQLGDPPGVTELRTAIASHDAAVRRDAVRALGAAHDPANVPMLATVATDDADRGVRRAAIEQLGAAGAPSALAALERIYVGPHPEDRADVLRALHQAGGRPAAEALARLAFDAPPEARAQAVAFLMMTVPADDPLLARVRSSHPDAAIRELVEHGLPKGEH